MRAVSSEPSTWDTPFQKKRGMEYTHCPAHDRITPEAESDTPAARAAWLNASVQRRTATSLLAIDNQTAVSGSGERKVLWVRGPFTARTNGVVHARIETMSPESHRNRLLMLLALTFTAAILALPHVKAEEDKQQDTKLVRGKTLEAWIAQLDKSRTLEDRQNALQVLRNDGLRIDRERTLRAFSDALSDKSPSVRSLAAAGLLKAGRPTDPQALARLAEIISADLSTARPPESTSDKEDDDVGFPIREIRAVGEIGEEEHIAALRTITENQKVHLLLRQFADRAIRQIRKRAETREVRSSRDYN